VLILILSTWVGLLWAVLSSFAAVVAERVPRGESINGRSHCSCRRLLKPWENIPILGWLSCAGKARCCDARIPARYVVSESACFAAGTLLTGCVLVMFGVTPLLPAVVTIGLGTVAAPILVVVFLRRLSSLP
jgi:leader peptidase (prepilin peptidase)/N-methyltransferase